MLAWMPIVIFMIAMALGAPVAFAMLFGSLFYFLLSPDVPASILVQRLIAGVDSFTILAVPFFVMAGTLMSRGGITDRLFNLADALVGHLKGGLGHVNVLQSVFIGGMSGSANADAAIDCKTLVPVMIKHGYSKAFTCSVTAASGIIAAIIPPSLAFVIYALIAEVSIGRLFIGGIIPGLLIAAAEMVVVAIISHRRGYGGARSERARWPEVAKCLKEAFWALMMPVILIGGLRMGAFTPTELGAVAVIYALLVGTFVYKEIKPREVPGVLLEATLATCVIMFIIGSAMTIGYILTWEMLPQKLVAFTLELTQNKFVVLVMINVILLVLGCFFESLSMMIILTPLLAPVLTKLGVDLVHFGLILTVNVGIGGITPPVGTILYTVCAITRVPVRVLMKDLWWFIVALISVLLLLTFVPEITLFLPRLVFG
jgi:tripartite ATP-independent transporter DctM subunit